MHSCKKNYRDLAEFEILYGNFDEALEFLKSETEIIIDFFGINWRSLT